MIKIEFQEECGLCITKGLKWHLVFLCILEWCEVKMLFMKILSARMHIHSRQHNMKYFNETLVNDEFTDHILITNVLCFIIIKGIWCWRSCCCILGYFTMVDEFIDQFIKFINQGYWVFMVLFAIKGPSMKVT